MSLFKNLARIVTAPLEVVDKMIVEPLADAAEEAATGWKGEDET